jgi:hypothetical protein
MKTCVPHPLTKHEALKQHESSERRVEHRRIERLQRVLLVKMDKALLTSRAA